jgi:site-specific recombinase XerD
MRRLTLDDARERYLRRRATTASRHTLTNYRDGIASLYRFLRTDHPAITHLDQIRRAPHVEGWLHFLATRRPAYSKSTRRNYPMVVRRFLNDACAWGWVPPPVQPMIEAKEIARKEGVLPRALSERDDLLLQRALGASQDLMAKGLLLMRRTGLRIGELRFLEEGCLTAHRAAFSLRVPLGKLHTERIVPLDPQTVHLAQDIHARCAGAPRTVHPETGKRIKLFFCRASGKAFCYETLRAYLARVAAVAGLSARVTTHQLRHTYATDLLRNGLPLPVLMKLLGHHALSMTLRYVHLTQPDAVDAHQRATAQSRERYGSLLDVTRLGDASAGVRGASIAAAFEELLSHLQKSHLSCTDSKTKRRLQRAVESIKRTREKTLAALG